jgi:undecaprenyl-diphosphatase
MVRFHLPWAGKACLRFIRLTYERRYRMIIEVLKALFLGFVEGITEWLPISSTGHMILVDEFLKLNVSEQFLAMFLVVIQIGAIMAVIILYFTKLNPFSRKKTRTQRKSTWRLWGMVLIGCIPAAIIGVLFDDWVHDHFYNGIVVASMLIVYGIIFIVMERRNRRLEAQAAIAPVRGKHARPDTAESSIFRTATVDDIDIPTALKIGAFQCLAIIPGTSRSGATIIGGMLSGCSRVAATEFTFFLAIPIMFGWGIVKVIKFLATGLVMSQTEIAVLIAGVLCAFVVSVLSIKFLMGYIKKNDFTAFGWYRIVVGLVVLGYFGAKGMGLF